MSTLQVKNVQKLGQKKENFVYNVDNETTAKFGEVNPLCFSPIEVGDETHKFSFNTVVRLAPLVNPVFGRIMYKVTHHFVSLRELFPKYESVLSELPKGSLLAQSNSTNDSVSTMCYAFPQMSLNALFACFIQSGRATWRVVRRTGNGNVNNNWLTDSSGLNDGGLRLFFGGANHYSQNNGLIEASDLNFYKYADYNLIDNHSQDTLLPENSDFQVMANDGDDFMLLIKLTEKGRRLFKILTGLGYRVSFLDETPVNLLPLFAYYKAWFDYYSISSYQNYNESNCGKLLYLINNDNRQLNVVHNLISSVATYEVEFNRLFKLFLDDLTENTYYTDNVDFVSACLPADGTLPSVNGVVQSLDGLVKFPSNSTGNLQVQELNYNLNVDGDNSSNIAGPTAGVNPLDFVSIEMLKRLYIAQHSNASTANDIAARLRAKGYSTYVEDVDAKFLGEFSFPIKVSDVDSTVDNYNPESQTGKPLGAYAGKGLAFKAGDSFTFEARELGYVISLAVIYPITKVVNALPHYLKSIDRFTWYNPEYDGLSFEEVGRNQVGHFTGTEYVGSQVRENQRFGFLPRYTAKKTSTSNILNGGFALKSERNFWLPYSLDRVIVENEYSAVGVELLPPDSQENQTNSFRTFDNSSSASYFPTAGMTWRYIDNLVWKGNYDRIFTLGTSQNADSNWVNLTLFANPMSDNFIIQTEIDHNAYINMLSVEDSWQTQDDDKPHVNISQKQ